jgi:hypothetical protein
MAEEEILEAIKISKENWAKMVPIVFDFFVRTPLWNFASPHFKEVCTISLYFIFIFRFDFLSVYSLIITQCVKEKYFSGLNTNEIEQSVHKSFIEYYETKQLSLRKVEVLPYHLLQTLQFAKLKTFLLVNPLFT